MSNNETPKSCLSREIERWRQCDPSAMARMSEAAIMYALSDARADILALHAENERLRAQQNGPARFWTEDQIDENLDAILKAAGSGLRHYSMAKTRNDMRQALRRAVEGGAA